MNTGKSVLTPFGNEFTAIDKGYYRRIVANGGDKIEEREILEKESKQLNETVVYSVCKNGLGRLSAIPSANLHNMKSPTKVDTVAVIPVKGVMQKYSAGYWYRTVGTQEIIANIQAAVANPAVSAIVLDFDSGGGMVDGNYVFCDAIYQAQNSKPVYGYVNGMAASAAYQAAAQCEKLFTAGPTDYVGSIGVFQIHVDESGWLEQWGLKVSYIVADGGEDKIVAPSTSPLSDDDRQKIVSQLNNLRSIMISQIERGRGNRIKPTEATYRGGIFSSKEAQKMGLIDGTASLEDVIIRAYKAGEKKKRNGSSSTSLNNNQNNMSLNLKSVLGGLLGMDDTTPTFTEDQVLSPEEATAYAKKTAEVVENKKSAEAERDAAILEKDEANAKVQDLTNQLAEANDKINSLETRLAVLENKEPETPKEETPKEDHKAEGEKEETPKAETESEGHPKEEQSNDNQSDYTILLEKINGLAGEISGIKSERDQAAKKASELEGKYGKLVAEYNELAKAQGKKGFVEDDEDDTSKKKSVSVRALPPVSKYTRIVAGWQ